MKSRRGPGLLLGLLTGMLVPPSLAVMFYATVASAPCVLLPTVASAMLGAWGGVWALGAASLSCVGMGYSIAGGLGALAAAELFALPAWAAWALLARRPRFVAGAWGCALAQLAAILALLAGAWLAVRAPLADAFTQFLLSRAHGLPWEAPEMADLAAALSPLTGGQSLAYLEEEERYWLLQNWFALYRTQLQRTLPQLILGTGLASGFLAYWLPARVASRRGDMPPVDYAHPRDWFLPGHMVLGPPLCALACYGAYRWGMAGGEAGLLAMLGVSQLFFTIQGLGAVDRAIFRRGMRPVARALILTALALLAQLVLTAVGLISALLGRRGLITRWLNKRGGANDKGGNER